MHTPVSWRKRKRLTLKSHTVKTVMINKNIMANKKAVSMVWYLFSFSAAALSFSFSTSTVLVSVIAKINAKRAHNFTNSVDLFAAMLMPGWWQASIQATTVKAKGRNERGTRDCLLLSRHLWKLFPGVCCKGYQGWTCSWSSWKSWANFFKWLLLSDEIVCYRLHNSTGTFCVWAKVLKQTGNDFCTLTENSSILVHETFESLTLGVRGFFFRTREKKRGKAFSHFPEKKETSGTEA